MGSRTFLATKRYSYLDISVTLFISHCVSQLEIISPHFNADDFKLADTMADEQLDIS